MIRIALCFVFVASMLFAKAQNEVADQFIGTWIADRMDSEDMTELDSIEFEEMKGMLVFIFEQDGVFSIPMPEEMLEELGDAAKDLEDMNGSWSLEEGNKVNICFEKDNPETCELLDFVFTDKNHLLLTDGDEGVYFIRK